MLTVISRLFGLAALVCAVVAIALMIQCPDSEWVRIDPRDIEDIIHYLIATGVFGGISFALGTAAQRLEN